MQIHPTAIVHPKAQIEDDVAIGPYSVIGEHVRIRRGTQLMSHVNVEGWTESVNGARFTLLPRSAPRLSICNIRGSRHASSSNTMPFCVNMSPSIAGRYSAGA